MIRRLHKKKIRAFVWVFFGLIGFFLVAIFLMMVMSEGELSDSSKEQHKEALEIIFREHIMPKTLQDGIKTENMDKAISEEIALLKEKQNPLYKDLALIQENYRIFLMINGKPCEIQKNNQSNNKYLEGLDDIKQQTRNDKISIWQIKNPYHISIQSMIDISQGKNAELELPSLETIKECVEQN